MTKKKNEPEKKPRVHKDLEGFEIGISPTGQVISNFTHDQINEFLNKHVKDKKLTTDQKSEQDDRMFPLQTPNDAEDADDYETFLREAGLKRKSKGKGKDKNLDPGPDSGLDDETLPLGIQPPADE